MTVERPSPSASWDVEARASGGGRIFRARDGIWGYGLAVLFTVMAVAASAALAVYVHGLAPFVTFFPTVLAATLLGGLGPGLLSTLLAALWAWWFWLGPEDLLASSAATTPVNLALFVGACLAVILTAQATRRYHGRSLAADRRFDAAEDLALDGFAILEAVREPGGGVTDFRWTHANLPMRRMLSFEGGDIAGRRLLEARAGHLARLVLFPRFVRVFESGLQKEEEIAHDGGRGRVWYRVNIVKLDGSIALSLRDISGRKEREDALRESEERFRLLADGVDDVFWIIDLATQKVVYVSPAYERVWGFSRATLYREPRAWRSHLHPDDQAIADPAFDDMLAGRRQSFELVYRMRSQDGGLRWVRDKAWLVRAGGTERVVGVMTDITAEKAAEEKERLLRRELEHRLRNSFALVHSILRLSARGAGDLGAFVASLEARLQALARGQDLVTKGLAQTATIEEVVRETLSPYAGAGERFEIGGSTVRMEAAAVPLMHMAFHELAANAAKYGALSAPSGRISIRWETTIDERSGVFLLVWRESGGPPVAPPQRRGFGSRLVEQALAMELGGDIRITFAPTGVVCTMRLPLSERLTITTDAGRPDASPPEWTLC